MYPYLYIEREAKTVVPPVFNHNNQEQKHEHERLRNVIGEIQRQIDELKKIPRYTGSVLVEQALDDARQQRLQRLNIARPAPYFGRLDFQAFSPTDTGGEKSSEKTGQTETAQTVPLYIGKAGVEGQRVDDLLVIDWRAPVASLFYSFSGQSDTASYESPDGLVSGVVHLKRHLDIREQSIQRMVDSYIRGGENLGVTDEFLLYRLEEHKDNRLRDIVSTIQSEQDKIIRAERNKALVIQGVPGSGKTTVALHRLAFLLYQYQDKMRPEKMVVFAPNTMFLDYISSVLPELGVGDIRQNTFTQWALDILQESGKPIKLRDQSESIIQWFEDDHAELNEGERNRERSLFKGSIEFLEYLRAELDRYEASFVPQKDFQAWERAELKAETVRDWFYNEYKNYPLAKRKEKVNARIKRWIELTHWDFRQRDPRGEWKKQANKRLQAYMKSWPRHSAVDLYVNLANMKKNQLETDDLAALLYVHLRLYGIDNSQRFDHVVIDEAQDFSPIQLAVVKEYSRNHSFTILGDLLQNIYTSHGIRNWQEAVSLFDESESAYYQMDRSYRSTMEIIQFANEIAQQIVKMNQIDVSPPQPVFRSGEPVKIKKVDRENRLQAVMDAVEEATGRRTNEKSIDGGSRQIANTVAIVTRTLQESRDLHTELCAAGLEANLIVPGQTEYKGGLSVIPVYLTKGLEFDAVIMMDTDEAHYPNDSQNAKLLYVGCTRALHRLWLFYSNRPTPLIEHASLITSG